jgi:DNA repair protein RadC
LGSLFYFHKVMSEKPFTPQSLSIKTWAEDDRPREKMMQKGRDVLSNAELIAILIGSGSRNESAVELSKRILGSVDNDLHRLSQLSLKELNVFKGIGDAKAVSIAAALELGRRRKAAEIKKDVKITSSQDAYEILYPYLSDLDHEQFYVILLKRNNSVIDTVRISQGGVTGTVVDAKIIFKTALEKLATSIVLAHNHPSGNLKPSTADIRLTDQLVQAGKLLDILVIDHVIVAGERYFSFADESMLKR